MHMGGRNGRIVNWRDRKQEKLGGESYETGIFSETGKEWIVTGLLK